MIRRNTIERHSAGTNFISLFFIISLGISLILFSTPSVVAQPLKPFTFILDFLPYGEYTPYFTALDKGWYKEEGLDVKILRGAGSGDTVKRIAVGQGDAGSADFSALTAARANEDIKVKAIAAYFRRPPHTIFVRTDSGINSPKDLEGKTIAITPGNSHQILFPLFAQGAGFKAESVKWITMDGAAMGPALITGRVDGAPLFANHEARLQKQAREQGKGIKPLSYAQFGLDMYSLVIITREETIQKNSDSLKRFLRATVRGMKYAFAPQNIEEGAKVVVKFNPEVDLEAATGAAQVASRYSFTEEVTSGKVAVGQFETARVEKSIGIYTQYLNLKKKISPEVIYTNDLLPEKK